MKKFTQTVIFDTTPKELYNILMDSKKHAKFTNDKASISKKVGGKFTAYGDYIDGKNIKLVKDKLIVQSWHASDWPKEHYSEVTYKLTKKGNKTKLVFTQKDIPDKFFEEVKQGWTDYYWDPIMEMIDNI